MPRVQATPSEIQKHLALLGATVLRVAACTASLDEARLRWSPTPKDWSAVHILAHLRACDDLWTHSIYAMLALEQPDLPAPLEPRGWAKVTRYAERPFHESFQMFTLRRAELLAVLRPLPEEAWSRAGRIEGRNHTVFSQTRRMALHEEEHCAQMEALFQRGG